MSIDDSTRQQLAQLARLKKRRRVHRAARWEPRQVRNPASELDVPFTEPGAWDFIASRLEDGHDVQVITLDNPRGKTGYVMKIELGPAAPRLYVKVQLDAGRIFGRSFHYSTHG